MVRQELDIMQLNIDIGDGRVLGYDGGEVGVHRYPLPITLPLFTPSGFLLNHRRGQDRICGWVYRAWVADGDRLWVEVELANAVAQAFADGDAVWGVDTSSGVFHSRDVGDMQTLVITDWQLDGLTVLPRARD